MLGKISQFCVILLLLVSIQCCDQGEFADANGVCQQCDISCNTCRSGDGCATCYDQMYLVTKGNRVLCDVCYNVNKGCDVCLTNNKCSNCSNGFYLRQDNTCAKCNQLISNCLLCKTDNSTMYCVSCSSPFKLVGGTCINGKESSTAASSSSNDQTANQATTVQTANQATPSAQPQTATSQTNNLNTPSNDQNSNQNSNGNGNVQTITNPNSNPCAPSEVLLKGNCFQSIAFCENYDDSNGNCLSCSSIFVLSNGYCLPAALLMSQTPNQDSVQSLTNLISTSPPAAETNSNNCKARQYSRNGQCVDVGAQCTQFDPTTGACYKCASNFDIYNGLCVQKDSGSQQIPAATDSTPPSSNNSPTPTASTDNCKFADPDHPTFCLVCIPNFTFVDQLPGVCVKNN